MSASIRRINAVALSLFAVLAVASWFLSLSPALVRADEAEQLKRALTEASVEVHGLSREEELKRQQVEEAAERFESVSVRLVSIDERNSRLADLTALATASGLLVDEINPGEPKAGELFEHVEIRLRGRGGFTDVARFMHRLSDEQPDTEVRTFRSARSGGEAVFEMRLVWRALPSETKRGTSP